MVTDMPEHAPRAVPAPTNSAGSPDPELARARAAAAQVLDPEIPVITIDELGMLRGVRRAGNQIVVEISPTYTGCPATSAIQLAVEAAVLDAGVPNAKVVLVLSPAWTTDDINLSGRAKLRAFGIAPPERRGKAALLFGSDVVACPRCTSLETTRISEFGSTACKALWRCETCKEPFDYFKCI